MKRRMLNKNLSSMLKAAALTACLCAAGAFTCLADDGSVIISTDYPGVSAKPGASVSFPLYIVNNGTTEQDAALAGEGLPEGWTGYFRGTDSEISSVHISAIRTKLFFKSRRNTAEKPAQMQKNAPKIRKFRGLDTRLKQNIAAYCCISVI